MEQILPRLPLVVSLSTALAFVLSIIYDLAFFANFDLDLFQMMTISDHVTSGLNFLHILILLLFLTFLFILCVEIGVKFYSSPLAIEVGGRIGLKVEPKKYVRAWATIIIIATFSTLQTSLERGNDRGFLWLIGHHTSNIRIACWYGLHIRCFFLCKVVCPRWDHLQHFCMAGCNGSGRRNRPRSISNVVRYPNDAGM
jgi:hypothetical protein